MNDTRKTLELLNRHLAGTALDGRRPESTKRPLSPEFVLRVKLRLLQMHFEAGVGHIGGNLSAIDTLLCLYHNIMQPDDSFVLSKGHAAGALKRPVEHRGAEIDAGDLEARVAAQQVERQIACPAAHVQHARAAGHRQFAHGATAPTLVHAAREEPVGRIVAGRDRCEHLADVDGFFHVPIGLEFPARPLPFMPVVVMSKSLPKTTGETYHGF